MGINFNKKMFKTISAVALVASSQAAINGEFFSGLQTGITVTNVAEFAEFQCPEPMISGKVAKGIQLFNAAKGVLAPKNDDEVEGKLESTFNTYEDHFAMMFSLADGYEAGDFCQGLTFGYE